MEVNREIHIDTEPVASTACPKCGAILDVANRKAFADITCAACRFEFEVPARFGNFILLQVLGMGGMGAVYRARDEALNREVAIKVMQKHLGEDPAFIENFQREAQSAAKLNHPNIAQIYSFGQALGQPYIVMELLSGGSLDRLMADQGPLDPAVVMHIGQQIAEGLREAAEAGLVHGDVKPENILFDNDKNAKLLDFGLAAMNKSPTAEIWGTPFYIPPEKVKKQPTDFRSDIYSLGATLYHAIAGVPPFDGTDVTAVVKARFLTDPSPLRSLRGSVVPEEVDGIILRMMEKEPSKRFPTYGSLLSDMRRFLSKAGPVNMAPPSKKIMIKGKRPKAPAVETGQLASAVVSESKKKPKFTLSKPDQQEEAPSMNKLEEEFAEIAAQKKKARKMVGLIVGGIFAAITLIVVSILLAYARIDSNKKQREKVAIEKVQEASRAAIVKAITEARKFVSYIKESEPQALKYANDAKGVLVSALGEEVRSGVVPQEPEYNVPVFGEEAEVSPSTGVATAATTNANKVVDGATNKVVDVATPKVEKKETVAPKKPQPLQLVDEGNEELKTKYPVVKTVRGMYMEAYRVKYAMLLANAMFAEIEKLSVRAEKLTAAEKAEELRTLANTISEKVKTMGYTKELTEVARNVSGLKKTLDSVRAEVSSLLAFKRLEEIEKAKNQKREAEEAVKRKEAEELVAKAKVECEKIGAVEATNIALLKALQFREAMRNLNTMAGEVTTKGGTDAMDIAKERVRRIEEAIKYVLNKAQGYKSPKGWVIEAVDTKTLTVSSKKLAWADIFNTRMEVVNELFNALVLDPAMTKDMRVRERTRLEVGTAICLWMYYRDVATAVERAKQIATKASQDFPSDAELTKQLMPGVLE
jgi:serine/threonine protein kinase